MRQSGFASLCALVCLQCGSPGSGVATFLPSSDSESEVLDGPEEPTSDDPGTDTGDFGGVVQALGQTPGQSLQPAGWRPMRPSASAGFAARSGAVVVWAPRFMLVYGGRLADGSYSTEIAGYSPGADLWVRSPSSPLSPRSHAVAVWTGRKIYIFGGRNATYRHMSSGGVYLHQGLGDGIWYTIRSAPHVIKCDEQGVWSPSTQEMLVFGCTGSAANGYVAAGLAYDTVQKVWRELPPPPMAARLGARVTWAGGKMVVLGGGDPVTRAPLGDGGEFDPVTRTWEHINTGLPRLYAAVGLTTGRHRDQASIWGGRPADGATAFDDGATYDPAAPMATAWASISSPGAALPDPHRRYVSSWYYDDSLFLWGGQRYVAGQDPIVLGSGAVWDLAQRKWSALVDGGPTPRAGAYALAAGSEAIIWGGFDKASGGERLLDDGMIYQLPSRKRVAASVSAGFNASCAFVEDGALECWGYLLNTAAVDTGANPLRPYVIKSLRATGPHTLSVGGSHACAITASEGPVHCWGSNSRGEIAPLGTISDLPSEPVVAPLPSPATQVSAAAESTCALLTTGEVWCWGRNSDGQCGNGTQSWSSSPGRVPGISNAVQIAAGGDNACALLSDGTARCWGQNINGVVGDGTGETRLSPVRVIGLTDIAEIGVGIGLACARKRDGTVYCWGSNHFSGLGQGTTDLDLHGTPAQVPGLTEVVKLAVGSANVCAARESGQLLCWGSGVTRPAPVLGIDDVSEVSTALAHVCARKRNSEVYCWGKNDWGQLGDGTNITRSDPREVLW